MTYTAPTDDDLNALSTAIADVNAIEFQAEETRERLALIEARLKVETPPPPPPKVALPPVGVVGASSWNAMTPVARQAALNLIAEAGITHFRLGVPWSSVERVKGKYQLDLYKTLVREVVAAGLIPLAVLGYCPSFYRRLGKDMFSAPTAAGVPAFGAYCRAVFAALVPLGCFRYEVWNEPNHAGPPGMNPVEAPTHADLCFEAHAAAADISRHIRLVAGAISPAPDAPPLNQGGTLFLQNTLAHEPDFFSFIDEWSLHPYAGKVKFLDGPMWTRHYGPTRALVPKHVGISATECGWATAPGKGVTEQQQAAFLVDAILSWPEPAPFYIFNWRDWGTGAERDNSQGLVRLDGTLRPSYFAVKNLLVG